MIYDLTPQQKLQVIYSKRNWINIETHIITSFLCRFQMVPQLNFVKPSWMPKTSKCHKKESLYGKPNCIKIYVFKHIRRTRIQYLHAKRWWVSALRDGNTMVLSRIDRIQRIAKVSIYIYMTPLESVGLAIASPPTRVPTQPCLRLVWWRVSDGVGLQETLFRFLRQAADARRNI